MVFVREGCQTRDASRPRTYTVATMIIGVNQALHSLCGTVNLVVLVRYVRIVRL